MKDSEDARVRDLLKDPAWQPQDLGSPMPDSPHACSACLPTWQSVIDYEEGRKKIHLQLRAGYPRFVLNPLVKALFAQATEATAGKDELAYVFPSREVAQRAQRFIEKAEGGIVKVSSFDGLQAVIVNKKQEESLKRYWQYTGEVVSSRQAEDVLGDGLNEETEFSNKLLTNLARSFNITRKDLFLYESGMAGIFTIHRLLTGLSPAKKTLQIEFAYTDALKVQEQFGSGVVMLSEAKGESLGEALQRIRAKEFAAVFCEMPGNPLLKSVDLLSISQACRDSGTILVVDDTVVTHHNVDVLSHADIVTSSLTKLISGVGDVMGGSVRINPNSPKADNLRATLEEDSPSHSRLYESDAEVLVNNLKGFRERMKIINRNTALVADFLKDHSAINQIWYPKFTTADDYERVKKKGGGYGPLISITLANKKKAANFYNKLEWNKGPSLGTEFSLACPYTLLAHYKELDWAEGCGVPPDLIRLSVGIEDPQVLIAALERALK